MKLPTLFTAAALLILAAIGHTQGPPPAQYVPPAPTQPPAPTMPPDDKLAPLPQPVPPPTMPIATPTPAEQTVEQVLDALEKIKAEKAALEKKEQALADLLNKKLDAQKARVKKLGLEKSSPPATEPKPDYVGPIVITPAVESPSGKK